MKKATQADIAKALGISQATVALVVGDTDSPLRQRLNPQTVLRIQEKARELGYVPHRGAQMMRRGRSNLLALLNFGGYSELAAKRVYHVGRLIHKAGFDFQTFDAYWWAGDAKPIVNQIISMRPEGIIIVGSVQNDFGISHIEELTRQVIPIVTIGLAFEGVPRVRYDARSAFRTLTHWYLDKGRNHIVTVIPKAEQTLSWQVQERLKGFQEAVTARSGRFPTVLNGFTLQKMESNNGVAAATIVSPTRKVPFAPFQWGMDAMESLLKWREPANGIIGINDEFAIGALTVCARNDIAVPDDIMVSGFDNLSYGTQGPVSLTSVEQPIEVMSEAAIEMLKQRLGKEPKLTPFPEEQIFPCEIIWRASTESSSAVSPTLSTGSSEPQRTPHA